MKCNFTLLDKIFTIKHIEQYPRVEETTAGIKRIN